MIINGDRFLSNWCHFLGDSHHGEKRQCYWLGCRTSKIVGRSRTIDNERRTEKSNLFLSQFLNCSLFSTQVLQIPIFLQESVVQWKSHDLTKVYLCKNRILGGSSLDLSRDQDSSQHCTTNFTDLQNNNEGLVELQIKSRLSMNVLDSIQQASE